MGILDPLALPAATALLIASAIVIHNYRVPTNIADIPALSNVLGNYASDFKDGFQAHMNEPGKITDSIARMLEKMLMINARESKEEQLKGKASKVYWQPGQSRWDKFYNPPTRTAIFAWIIFILSAQYIHEMHQADRYQNRFLTAGIIIGLNASVVAWILSAENLFAFKTFVPASVVGALVVSSLAHRLVIPKVEKEKKDQ